MDKLKIAQINMVSYGSTGKIMLEIAGVVRENGHIAKTFSTSLFYVNGPKEKKAINGHEYYGSFFENFIHYTLGIFTGLNGFFSNIGTFRLIRQLKKLKPDIIHLHNIHGYCISIPQLFKYIRKNNIKTVWTLHDCWAFTGKCPYFDMIDCNKWEKGCYKCPQKLMYPKSYVDISKFLYTKKKKIFCKINNLTLVTPSIWLSELTQKSFLGKYDVRVINNGIDLSVFKPRESDFRLEHNSKGKFIILGVAFGWGKRKGLDVFIELSKRLNEKFQIVLVGTDDIVDKELPGNIISIHRTENQIQLAEIYSAADLFVNPTREENYPTVNMEAIACGTPVITFDTGGSAEIIDDTCGLSVEKNNIEEMIEKIIYVEENHPFSKQDCIKRAEQFDNRLRYNEYLSLYEEICR